MGLGVFTPLLRGTSFLMAIVLAPLPFLVFAVALATLPFQGAVGASYVEGVLLAEFVPTYAVGLASVVIVASSGILGRGYRLQVQRVAAFGIPAQVVYVVAYGNLAVP